MPPPWLKLVKEDICIINNDDEFSFIPHKNIGKQLSVTKFSIFKSSSYVQLALKEKAKAVTQNKTTTPIFSLGNLVQIKKTFPHKNLANLNKVEAEAKAFIIA